MAANHLLDEFSPVSTQSWEEAIRKDLKGADYAKKLLWQTEEGLAVKPYYRAEDLAGLEYLNAAPGTFPYVRGTRATGDWRIREEIVATDPEKANADACAAVVAGAEEISFGDVAIKNASDLKTILANLPEIPVHFPNADEALIRLLAQKKPAALVSTGRDPFANFGVCGRDHFWKARHAGAVHDSRRGIRRVRSDGGRGSWICPGGGHRLSSGDASR